VSVELSPRAERDLRRIGRGPESRRIAAALDEELASDEPPANLDIVPLAGRAPWLRLRVGDWRILYRRTDAGVWVERILHRRDLMAAVATLPED
jgi:mRNA-degrading endonuclease RelE of RelBE toxin-antitoxin system